LLWPFGQRPAAVTKTSRNIAAQNYQPRSSIEKKKKQQQQRQINNENKNEQKPQSLALHDASLRSGSTFLSLQYKSAKMNGLMVISHSTGNQQQMQRYSFSEDASRPAGGVIIQSPRHYSVLVMTRNDVNRR
jgi:superfamily II DNA or RNA helicase